MTMSFVTFTLTTITVSLPSYNKRLISYSTISEGEPPHKKPNMSSLWRTHSFLSLMDLPNQPQHLMYMVPTWGQSQGQKVSMAPPAGGNFWACLEASIALSLTPITDPYNLQQKRACPAPPAPVATTSCAATTHPVYSSAPCVSSPLSPSSCPSYSSVFLHLRTGKGEPDLRQIAITTCMRSTPKGQKVLSMGPHVTMSIVNATWELEQIVTKGGMELSDDWEMIHCGA
ncbi:hypothetical protein EDD18DRAFT_1198617 [Armillaria luteobubalina]|uniref:Uncharacterized protein n=1 Tax=Armillaria luteobubalina TaxID=153913 RepID=A0AA39TEM9_9AGAR|nr:hypothetical protein EDD18DRAFT_1198617 [Armillaria luteobubalina]